MRSGQLLVAIGLVVLPITATGCAASPAMSGAFSTEQQQVIDRVATCNDAWAAAVARMRYETFVEGCPFDEGSLWWYPAAPGPATFRTAWDGSVSNGIVHISWRDLQPIAVTFDDDLAVVFYTVTWQPTGADGLARPHDAPCHHAATTCGHLGACRGIDRARHRARHRARDRARKARRPRAPATDLSFRTKRPNRSTVQPP
jgi:hypothetical protein